MSILDKILLAVIVIAVIQYVGIEWIAGAGPSE